jgi:hypothetical protein
LERESERKREAERTREDLTGGKCIGRRRPNAQSCTGTRHKGARVVRACRKQAGALGRHGCVKEEEEEEEEETGRKWGGELGSSRTSSNI